MLLQIDVESIEKIRPYLWTVAFEGLVEDAPQVAGACLSFSSPGVRSIGSSSSTRTHPPIRVGRVHELQHPFVVPHMRSQAVQNFDCGLLAQFIGPPLDVR